MASSPVFWIGVVVATIASMVIGAIWYGAFGNYWMSLIGKSREQLQNSPMMYVIMVIGSVATALVLALLVGLTGSQSVEGGIVIGLLVAIGFVATSEAANYLFEDRSSRLFGLNMGFHLIKLVVMGGIVGGIH